MIICIEGGDACGKATQSKILAERLGAARFSFPDYETPAGAAILSNLKGEWSACGDHESGEGLATWPGTNAMVLQSLMATNRLERGADLRKASARGPVVLDRYDASSIVYGGLDGLDPKWCAAVNEQLPVRPDLYILLDAPVDEGFRRRPERRDRYEKDRAFLEKVRVAYLQLFTDRQLARVRSLDEWPAIFGKGATTEVGTPWRVVDAVGTIDEVAERVRQAVEVTR